VTIPEASPGRRYRCSPMGQSAPEGLREPPAPGRPVGIAVLAEVAGPAPPRRGRRGRAGWPALVGAAVVAFLAGAVVGAVSNWFDAHRLAFAALIGAVVVWWLVPLVRGAWRGEPPGGRALGWLGAGALALVLAALGWVTVGVLVGVAACWHRYRRPRRRGLYRPKAAAMDTDRRLRPRGGTPSRSSVVRSSE